jgi:hypothetical protein
MSRYGVKRRSVDQLDWNDEKRIADSGGSVKLDFLDRLRLRGDLENV